MDFKKDLHLKETSILEAKAADKGLPRNIWETYSAFCNTHGGTILLGVAEDASTKEFIYKGVKNADSLIKDFWNTINNPQKVSYAALSNDDVRVEKADGKDIIVIEVPRVDRRNRPVFINNNLNSGTFRRNHDGDYHCTLPEIKEMIRDSESNTSDKSILDSLSMDSINLATVENYRDSLRAYKGGHPWIKLRDEEFLEVIGAAGRSRDEKLHPTKAGILMFGKEYRITDVFPEYLLDYREKNDAERWSYRLQSQSGEWSGNVFDFFNAVSGRLSSSVISPFELDGFVRRGDSNAFTVAREAVMNALIHADYSVGRGVIIEIRHNFMTVANPGTFRIPLSDAVRGGTSDPRNSQIMKMFLLVGLAEHIGSGLYTIVRSEHEGVITNAKIEESYDPSRVTVALDLSPKTPAVSQSASAVLDALRSDGSATTAALAEMTGVSVKTVSRALSDLKAAGRIVRIGGKRGGRWETR